MPKNQVKEVILGQLKQLLLSRNIAFHLSISLLFFTSFICCTCRFVQNVAILVKLLMEQILNFLV